MNVKLNVIERLSLLEILPKENSYAMFKAAMKLQETLGISEQELKDFDVHDEVFVDGVWERRKEYEEKNDEIPPNTPRRWSWNDKGKEEVELEIGSKAEEMIKMALRKIDKEKKFSVKYLTLWEKFIGEEE